ncbi:MULTISPECIES: hypothetical protein [Frankia]|uniref:Uncharacterized protein n=1 Tax=Frankia alni (strain DSM 45986 / CECT 9034 / ACN14a) TaxID=326424 RepID=Q0RT69_FRAAA|nr:MULTISPECIES: hypothetical protein [Frankia]CAJ59232.1 hypothetical protein FRAAL0557 [Frankia alni ACN14a]
MSQSDEPDELLTNDPLALPIGMVLDKHLGQTGNRTGPPTDSCSGIAEWRPRRREHSEPPEVPPLTFPVRACRIPCAAGPGRRRSQQPGPDAVRTARPPGRVKLADHHDADDGAADRDDVGVLRRASGPFRHGHGELVRGGGEVIQMRRADLGIGLRSNAVVVAQVWRDHAGRQAALARLLRAVEVCTVDERTGRDAGVLLGRAGTSDVVDATVVLLARPGDRILTSDPKDITRLVQAGGVPAVVVRC